MCRRRQWLIEKIGGYEIHYYWLRKLWACLAEEFSALGHEVIGADISESRVDSIKDKVATAFVIDATDEQSLSVLPLKVWMW